MDRAEITGRKNDLVGRERERATIDRLLDDATRGESRVVVIRGEAGIGKSALVEYAAQRAEEMIVLRAVGVEAESDLPFAGIYGLLRPVVAKLNDLPDTQAAALAGALGLAPSAGADRFLVSAAVLGLLAAAAEEAPVLCLIDDAQWLDRPSAEALVFAARRLAAERVAIVFSAREGDVQRFLAPGLAELTLAGLDAASSAAILASTASGAAPSVRARLLLEADGNPLALLELPGALSDAQLSGNRALPGTIPLTPRLQAVFRQRVEHLPEPTQSALLVAAADNTGDVASILRAVAELGLEAEVRDPAEEAGLIVTSRGWIAFRHPLVHSAVYEGATLSPRRQT